MVKFWNWRFVASPTPMPPFPGRKNPSPTLSTAQITPGSRVPLLPPTKSVSSACPRHQLTMPAGAETQLVWPSLGVGKTSPIERPRRTQPSSGVQSGRRPNLPSSRRRHARKPLDPIPSPSATSDILPIWRGSYRVFRFMSNKKPAKEPRRLFPFTLSGDRFDCPIVRR